MTKFGKDCSVRRCTAFSFCSPFGIFLLHAEEYEVLDMLTAFLGNDLGLDI